MGQPQIRAASVAGDIGVPHPASVDGDLLGKLPPGVLQQVVSHHQGHQLGGNAGGVYLFRLIFIQDLLRIDAIGHGGIVCRKQGHRLRLRSHAQKQDGEKQQARQQGAKQFFTHLPSSFRTSAISSLICAFRSSTEPKQRSFRKKRSRVIFTCTP